MGSTTSITIFGIPFSKTSGSSHIYNSTKGKWIKRNKYSIGPIIWYKRVKNNNTEQQTAGCKNRKCRKKKKTYKNIKK